MFWYNSCRLRAEIICYPASPQSKYAVAQIRVQSERIEKPSVVPLAVIIDEAIKPGNELQFMIHDMVRFARTITRPGALSEIVYQPPYDFKAAAMISMWGALVSVCTGLTNADMASACFRAVERLGTRTERMPREHTRREGWHPGFRSPGSEVLIRYDPDETWDPRTSAPRKSRRASRNASCAAPRGIAN